MVLQRFKACQLTGHEPSQHSQCRQQEPARSPALFCSIPSPFGYFCCSPHFPSRTTIRCRHKLVTKADVAAAGSTRGAGTCRNTGCNGRQRTQTTSPSPATASVDLVADLLYVSVRGVGGRDPGRRLRGTGRQGLISRGHGK